MKKRRLKNEIRLAKNEKVMKKHRQGNEIRLAKNEKIMKKRRQRVKQARMK